MFLIFAWMFILVSVVHTKSYIIKSGLEQFLRFNIYFCSKEIIENNLYLEKY
jgi:hypothetical protein